MGISTGRPARVGIPGILTSFQRVSKITQHFEGNYACLFENRKPNDGCSYHWEILKLSKLDKIEKCNRFLYETLKIIDQSTYNVERLLNINNHYFVKQP